MSPLWSALRFSEPIEVAGTPQLAIQVGDADSSGGACTIRRGSILYFEHVVQSSDVDADGFSVPADALTLNGGSIRDGDGNDADLTHGAVPDDPQRKVNGASGDAPTVRSRVVQSSRLPATQDTYVAGETIFIVVGFTGRRVQVTGTPRLTLQVGAQARRADHLPARRAAQLLPPGSGFHTLDEIATVYFRYVVQPSDVDDDGVSVPANAIHLNGGSIQDEYGNDANLEHDGLADDPRRKVDGSRSDDQAPTIFVGGILDRPVRGTFGAGDTITAWLAFSEGGDGDGHAAVRAPDRRKHALRGVPGESWHHELVVRLRGG